MPYVESRGVRVPSLGFGTWLLTGQECRDGVLHALDVGYRHVDTAQAYGNESQVGEALAASSVPREELFLTTKLDRDRMGGERVRSAVEESLERLRTDYVDLLLIHWPNPEVPLEETLQAMLEAQELGLVGSVGVSNFPPSTLREAVGIAPILTNQIEFHPYLSQAALHEIALADGHLLTAYSPLARGAVLDDPVITAIAEANGATPAQVTIAWLLAKPQVAVIPKASSPARIEENLAATRLELSEDERARIDALDRGPAGRVVEPPFAPDWEREA